MIAVSAASAKHPGHKVFHPAEGHQRTVGRFTFRDGDVLQDDHAHAKGGLTGC